MKTLNTILACFGLLLFLVPLSGYSQGCDNKVIVAAGGLSVRSRPNSTGLATFDYCPNGSSPVVLSGSTSTPNSTLSWTATDATGKSVPVTFTTSTDNGGTYSDITVNPSSNTTYTLTSISGCKNNPGTSNASVIIAPSLSITSSNGTSGSGSSVCPGSTTILTATGSSTGEYVWSAPGMPTVINSGTLTVNPTSTTTYTVTSPTSACGQATQTITVNVTGVTVSPAAPVICSGQQIALTASYNGTGAATYRWYDVTNSGSTLSVTNTLTQSPTATTTYQVDVTSAECGTVSQQVTVAIAPPTVVVSPSAATICAGNATTLTATSNNPGTTYSWRVKGANGNPLATTASVTVSPNVTTTYQLTATTTCNQVIVKDVVVTVETANNTISPTATAICSGTSTVLTASSNISGTTYKWYEGTTSTTIVSLDPTLTVSPSTTTTYRVDITNSCGTTTPTSTVTVNPAVTISPSQTIDTGGSATVTAGGSTTGVYSWTATIKNAATGATTVTPIASNAASITVKPAYTTIYTVTGTTASGTCTTAQSSVTVLRPLPVELISFEAVLNDKVPTLTWATASEKNSAYFDIERSFNGESFENVGQRLGAGTSSSRTNYQFVDARLTQSAAAVVYYRLRQVDVTGEVSYSPVRALQVSAASRAFIADVFPNPYDKSVSVAFHSVGTGAVTLTLHNVLGQKVLAQTVVATEGAQEINLPEAGSLPLGMYYLTIRQGAQQQVLRVSHR